MDKGMEGEPFYQVSPLDFGDCPQCVKALLHRGTDLISRKTNFRAAGCLASRLHRIGRNNMDERFNFIIVM